MIEQLQCADWMSRVGFVDEDPLFGKMLSLAAGVDIRNAGREHRSISAQKL